MGWREQIQGEAAGLNQGAGCIGLFGVVFGSIWVWGVLHHDIEPPLGPIGTVAHAIGAALMVVGGLWGIVGSFVRLTPGHGGITIGALVFGMGLMLAGAMPEESGAGIFARFVGFAFGLLVMAVGAGFLHAGALGGAAGRALAEASHRLGLATRQRYFRMPEARGEVRGVPVLLRALEGGEAWVEVGDARWGDLAIEREGSTTGLRAALRKEQVVTGDAAFDDLAFLRGDEATALALLTRPVRMALAEALQAGVVVGGGRLRARHRISSRGGGRGLPGMVDELVTLTALLPAGSDGDAAWPLSRLAHNALADPEPGVRLANLDALLRGATAAANLARSTSERAMEDADPRVRHRAARHLVETGAAGSVRERAERILHDHAGSLAIADAGTGGQVTLAAPAAALSLPDAKKGVDR